MDSGIDERIFAYFKHKGKDGHYEISLQFLDTYLLFKYQEKEYIGIILLHKIEEMILEGLIKKTTGSKFALTPKGITRL